MSVFLGRGLGRGVFVINRDRLKATVFGKGTVACFDGMAAPGAEHGDKNTEVEGANRTSLESGPRYL